MVYKEFLNAARKHKYTCSILLEKLDQINNKREPAQAKYLLLNVYYLSGYIIECIVKYGIYNLVGFSKRKEVTKLNQDGLRYKDHICHHKFNRFTQYLDCRIGISLPLIRNKKGINKKVVELYNKWDAPVRYSYELDLSEERYYIEFNKTAERIFQEIKNNVKG